MENRITEGLVRRLEARVDCEFTPEQLEKLGRIIQLRRPDQKASGEGNLVRRTEPRLDHPVTSKLREDLSKLWSSEAPTPGEPTPERKRKEPDVYFIRAEISRSVKIGYATDIRQRISILRTGSPEPLSLELLIPEAGREGEQKMHRKFAEYREHGEWFRPGARLERFIEEYKEVHGEVPIGTVRDTPYRIKHQ